MMLMSLRRPRWFYRINYEREKARTVVTVPRRRNQMLVLVLVVVLPMNTRSMSLVVSGL
jgi:hypothetical protein